VLFRSDEKKELAYNLGSVLEKMGKKAEAMKQYEEIFAVESTYKDVGKKLDDFYSGQSATT